MVRGYMNYKIHIFLIGVMVMIAGSANTGAAKGHLDGDAIQMVIQTPSH